MNLRKNLKKGPKLETLRLKLPALNQTLVIKKALLFQQISGGPLMVFNGLINRLAS